MKILKNATVARWISYGMLMGGLLCACGFFILPVAIQIIKGPIADQPLSVALDGPAPPIKPLTDYYPPPE